MDIQTPTSTTEGSETGSWEEFVEEVIDGNAVNIPNTRTDADKTTPADASKPSLRSNDNPPQEDEHGDGDSGQAPTSDEENGDEDPLIVYSCAPDADLLIGAGTVTEDNESTHHFLVSSTQLSWTSPVWKKLVRTAVVPNSKKKTKVLRIPSDDHSTSLSIFLKIIHLQFQCLPATLTFDEIYGLALFSDKYKVHDIFLPFIGKWIEPFMTEELDPMRVEWVRIAWEFCLARMFEAWVEHLCREAELSSLDEGAILKYRGMEVAQLFPETCRKKYTEYIEETRMAFLSGLLSICSESIQDQTGYCPCILDEDVYREQCNAMKNGYLMMELTTLLVKWEWPLNAKSIMMSASQLKEGLLSMRSKEMPTALGGNGSQEDHSECGVLPLKHCIMKFSLERRSICQEKNGGRGTIERVCQVEDERFSKDRRNAEMELLNWWRRMGFWRGDFSERTDGGEDLESESEAEYESEEDGSSEDEKDEMEVDEGWWLQVL